jgi:protein-tyrosine phosphatase
LLPRVSEIIPGLFIGDLHVAESAPLLASLGITHVLSAMRGFVDVPSELPIRRAQIPLDDMPFSELAAFLPTSTSFLNDAFRDPNARVLVHCVQGVSRSASVVAAYLMVRSGWTASQAVQFVKSKRAVDPNFGFLAQLHEYGESVRRSSSGR